MTSIIIRRSGQVLAVGALLIGVAFSANPIASATFDRDAVYKCWDTIPVDDPDWTFKHHKCCQDNGGVPSEDAGLVWCKAPTVEGSGASNAPKPEPVVTRVPDVGASLPPSPTKTVPSVPGPVRPGSMG